MSEADGIINAFILKGDGTAEELKTWAEVAAHWHTGEALWLHLHLGSAEAKRWLAENSGLDRIVCQALEADKPRPRSDVFDGGLVVALRGVNLNPGADPDDMISVRLWIDPRHIITVRRMKLMAIDDIRKDIARGEAPHSTVDLLAVLARRLAERMRPVLANLDGLTDDLEDTVLTAPGHEVRAKLAAIRRQAIALRRHIGPERDAMQNLVALELPWVGTKNKNRFREVADSVTRYVEDLDSIRERAAVMQDEVGTRLSEQINRNMYILSLIAVIFLPLGFITGLLGINVGGIPGEGTPWAFIAVCAVLGVVAVVEIWLLRSKKWF